MSGYNVLSQKSNSMQTSLLQSDSKIYKTSTHQNNKRYFSTPNSSNLLIEEDVVIGEQEIHIGETRATKSTLPMAVVATINGTLYFFVGVAGGNEIERLFNIEGNSASKAIYSVSALSGGANLIFAYKAFIGLTLRPTSCLSWSLAALSPFASSSYLTAGITGATKIGLPKAVSFTIGSTLFILKSVVMIDGSVKFHDKLKSLKSDFYNAYLAKNTLSISRLVFATATSIAISISTTDSIYSAMDTIFQPIITEDSSALQILCYTGSFLGALGIFPTYMYWINRGVVQLTNSGKLDEEGINNDPTDRYTYLSLLGSMPTILGVLGSAANSTGNVFGSLGTFASVIRVSSSVIATVCCCVPGISAILRDFVAFLPSAPSIYSWCSSTTSTAFNCCRRNRR